MDGEGGGTEARAARTQAGKGDGCEKEGQTAVNKMLLQSSRKGAGDLEERLGS